MLLNQHVGYPIAPDFTEIRQMHHFSLALYDTTKSNIADGNNRFSPTLGIISTFMIEFFAIQNLQYYTTIHPRGRK